MKFLYSLLLLLLAFHPAVQASADDSVEVPVALEESHPDLHLRIESCLQPRVAEETFEKLKCRELKTEAIQHYLENTSAEQQLENEMVAIDTVL